MLYCYNIHAIKIKYIGTRMTAIIKRTTLKVRDMEKSLVFYEQILCMRKYYDDKITLSGNLLPGGNAGDLTRLVIMEAKDPEIGKIGLLQWLNPSSPPPAVNYNFEYGQPVFVAEVSDAEKIYEIAKLHDIEIRAPLSEATYPAANGGEVKVRSVGLFDPDGHFFECNQRLEG